MIFDRDVEDDSVKLSEDGDELSEPDAGGGETRADTILCCISEMRTEARFWFLVKLCFQSACGL